MGGKGAIAAFFIAVLLALLWLFHSQEHIGKLAADTEPDQLSVAWLRSLSGSRTGDTDTRLQLAEHHLGLGQWQEAQAVLSGIRPKPSSPSYWPVKRLLLQGIQIRLSAAATQQERDLVITELRRELDDLHTGTAPQDVLDTIQALATSTGQLEQVAQVFHEVSKLAEDPNLARSYGLNAVNSARKAGQPELALNLCRHYLERFPDDRKLLGLIVDLAMEQDDTTLALTWIRRWRALEPDNTRLMYRERDIALAGGEPGQALQALQSLADNDASSVDAQRELARAQEWAGQPEKALQQWLPLATGQLDPEAIARSIEIATDLGQHQALVKVLPLKGRALTNGQLRQLHQSCLKSGRSADCVPVFKSLLSNSGRRQELLPLLASLQEDTGDLTAAADSWSRIATDRPIAARTEQSRLLWAIGQYSKAFAVLKASAKTADKDIANAESRQFWRQYAQQADELGYRDEAIAALQRLFDNDPADVRSGEQLLILLRPQYRDKALNTAMTLYRQGHGERFAIQAMDILASDGDWEHLRAFLSQTEQDKDDLAGFESYWLLRVRHARAEKDFARARQLIGDARRHFPASEQLELQYLWLLVESEDKSGLKKFFADHNAAAARSRPALWPAWAAGLSLIEHHRDALPWYQLQYEQGNRDSDFLLAWSRALAGSGYADQAIRIENMAVMSALQSRRKADWTEQQGSP